MLKFLHSAVILIPAIVCLLGTVESHAKGFHVGHALLGGVIGYELGKATSQPAQAAPAPQQVQQPAPPAGATIVPQTPPVIVTPECSSPSCVKEPEKKEESETGFWIFLTMFIGLIVLVGTIIVVM